MSHRPQDLVLFPNAGKPNPTGPFHRAAGQSGERQESLPPRRGKVWMGVDKAPRTASGGVDPIEAACPPSSILPRKGGGRRCGLRAIALHRAGLRLPVRGAGRRVRAGRLMGSGRSIEDGILMRRVTRHFALILLAALLGHAGPALAAQTDAKLAATDLAPGTGAEAVRHSRVTVHYTGWLADGTKFDSSLDRGEPFSFTLGGGQVIAGWDMGVAGMKVGGKRELVIPPELAYGQKGAGGVIPPGATLKFEIELLAVAAPKFTNVDNGALEALLEKGTRIVDLRRQDEWDQTGVIAGSERLTAFDARGQFNREFPTAFQSLVKQDEEVIVICWQGHRSSMIANMLAEQGGYTKVYNVTEGIQKWLKDGKPVVKK